MKAASSYNPRLLLIELSLGLLPAQPRGNAQGALRFYSNTSTSTPAAAGAMLRAHSDFYNKEPAHRTRTRTHPIPHSSDLSDKVRGVPCYPPPCRRAQGQSRVQKWVPFVI